MFMIGKHGELNGMPVRFLRGNCMCATFYIGMPAAVRNRLPTMRADQSEMLESSLHRVQASWIACLLRLSADLDEPSVAVAQEG